jgi:hypothetical protein
MLYGMKLAGLTIVLAGWGCLGYHVATRHSSSICIYRAHGAYLSFLDAISWCGDCQPERCTLSTYQWLDYRDSSENQCLLYLFCTSLISWIPIPTVCTCHGKGSLLCSQSSMVDRVLWNFDLFCDRGLEIGLQSTSDACGRTTSVSNICKAKAPSRL